MPIVERDPWRMQYFEHVACPDDVVVPTEDGDAYLLFPKFRWIYNKLLIAESQGLACGLHGMAPETFPVFSKPVYNMRGMGAGSRIFRTRRDYQLNQRPGHMWMELLKGEHVSTDAAVVRMASPAGGATSPADRSTRACSTTGPCSPSRGPRSRTIAARGCGPTSAAIPAWSTSRPSTPGSSRSTCASPTSGRTCTAPAGPRPWSASTPNGVWDYPDDDRRDGYSVVLFGPHGLQYWHPDPELVAELLKEPSLTSIQITFHEDKPPKAHSMPPGGFRLAIINGWDLDAGRQARERLALRFWATQRIVPRRPRRKAALAP